MEATPQQTPNQGMYPGSGMRMYSGGMGGLGYYPPAPAAASGYPDYPQQQQQQQPFNQFNYQQQQQQQYEWQQQQQQQYGQQQGWTEQQHQQWAHSNNMEWGSWARGQAMERRGSQPAQPPVQPSQAAATPAAASDSYLRTLQYVKNCQDWSTTPDGAKPKRSPPPHNGAMPPPTAMPMPQNHSNGMTIMQNGMTNGAHMGGMPVNGMPQNVMPSKQDNMVLGDMNSSMSSLMEETRYLQMLQ